MVETRRKDLSVRAERAVLLGTFFGRGNGNESLIELAKLAETAGARVVEDVIQKRGRIDPAYYIGKGKALEIASLCRENDIDVVICDDDLTPAQVRNLEYILNAKVIDRSELILDIFATHAKTRQAQLQVELAQLEYTLPRLKRMWTHLERQVGGIGTRGPGEKQLEVDRRLVSKKIQDLKRKLRQVEERRYQQVASRKDFYKVSLVGYTNAGKSTLMNALTHAQVLVEDKLFSTLDTKTRLLPLENGRKVLLSDTVGFIRKLPHHLVASFHATLEEVRQADLLLHVVDVSSPAAVEQAKAVNVVLEELGSINKPIILVLNKIDALENNDILTLFRAKYPYSATVSALTGYGLLELKKEIAGFLERRCVELKLTCGTTDGKVLAYIYENGCVLDRKLDGNKLHFHVLMEEKYVRKLSHFSGDVVITQPSELSPPVDKESQA